MGVWAIIGSGGGVTPLNLQESLGHSKITRTQQCGLFRRYHGK